MLEGLNSYENTGYQKDNNLISSENNKRYSEIKDAILNLFDQELPDQEEFEARYTKKEILSFLIEEGLTPNKKEIAIILNNLIAKEIINYQINYSEGEEGEELFYLGEIAFRNEVDMI